MVETALQRETRLTGKADLLETVQVSIAKVSATSNIVLARKVVSRFCHAQDARDFYSRIKDFVPLNEVSALGMFAQIQRLVEILDSNTSSASTCTALPAEPETEGGLRVMQNKDANVRFAYKKVGLGLDKIAQKQIKLEPSAKPKQQDLFDLPIGEDDRDEPGIRIKRPPESKKEEIKEERPDDRRRDDRRRDDRRRDDRRDDRRDERRGSDRRRDDERHGGPRGDRRDDERGPKKSGMRMFKGNASKPLGERAEPTTARERDEEEERYMKITGEFVPEGADELTKKMMLEADLDEFEQEQIDNAWYDRDEGQTVNQEQQFGESMTEEQLLAKEEKMKKQVATVKRMNPYARQRRADNEEWELNRLRQAGLAERTELDLDFDQEETKHISVLVRETVPPFLDGRYSYTTQQEQVTSVRDPTADMATAAKRGSAVLKHCQQERDRTKMRERFWELAGSTMGSLLGVKKQMTKEEEEAAEADVEDNEYDYRKGNQFSAALRSKKNEAQSAFARTNTIQEQRASLPVYHVKQDLMNLLREHSIIIAVGETGSGKTTQMTQYLHEAGYTANGMVGCTQPRRVAAVSVAKRVSEEFGCQLGEEVGYAIRFEDVTTSKTIIKYMTDGVMLRETLVERDLDKYSAVIMDEAHERSLNTDVLFGILKNIVARRRDFKLIVTSATLDSNRFSNYFGHAPVFQIPGRTFPVEINFSRCVPDDYVDQAVQQAISIHVTEEEGDILIFMTGQADIEASCVLIAERLQEVGNDVAPLAILPIYSGLPSEIQAKIFQKSEYRKVIVATNIAETSLTVDGVRYVIDTGYCKLKVYNPKVGMDSLLVTPISQANANQRSGRAGRTGPGACWRLYTESAFVSEMFEMTIPEIQRTNLANVVLLLKSLGIKNLLDFDFMDPPPQETILNSLYQLWMLGALDNLGEVTQIGSRMSQFPMEPSLSKMLITAEEMECVAEVLTVVSMLSVPSIFYRPKDRADESDAAREKFSVPESDHLTLLNVYQQWKKNGYSGSWCTEHFIHQKTMKKVREVRGQLSDILQSVKIVESSCGTEWDIVRKAICSGYFHNASKLRGVGEYINLRNSIPCHLHPTSALYGLGYTPDYIVYHEVVFTVKEYMQQVTAVNPQWLSELGPMFFSTHEVGQDYATIKKREREDQKRMEYEQQLQDDNERKQQRDAEDARLKSESTIVVVGKKRSLADRNAANLLRGMAAAAEGDSAASDASSSSSGARRRRKRTKIRRKPMGF
eukprot:GEMP01002534.1.p1 GENE.GEMP01002534.1~~GEMP01002534.1.p1  ORF type:complete len:1247 (+),score=319.69 GEMP01002534.1:21-3761(+)